MLNLLATKQTNHSNRMLTKELGAVLLKKKQPSYWVYINILQGPSNLPMIFLLMLPGVNTKTLIDSPVQIPYKKCFDAKTDWSWLRLWSSLSVSSFFTVNFTNLLAYFCFYFNLQQIYIYILLKIPG